MPKILLTGSFGNVGANIVRRVHELNSVLQRESNPSIIELTCFDKISPLTLKTQDLLRQECGENSFKTIWGDLCDSEQVKEIVQGQDSIIHAAALIPPAAYDFPDLAKKINVTATAELVEACNKQEQKPRFVFVSSYSVIGPRNGKMSLPLITSSTPVNPSDNYAAHKVAGEKIVKSYSGEYVILRLGAVSVDMKTIMGNRPKPSPILNHMLYGIPGDQRRHGVHSKDVARDPKACVEAAISSKDVSGKVFMIGGDATWCTRSRNFGNIIFRSLGVGSLSNFCNRNPPADASEAFYYEDWMDTTESEAYLNFQKHTLQDWEKELKKDINIFQYYLTRLFSLPIRWYLQRQSPYYQANLNKLEHPDFKKSFSDLIGRKPDVDLQ